MTCGVVLFRGFHVCQCGRPRFPLPVSGDLYRYPLLDSVRRPHRRFRPSGSPPLNENEQRGDRDVTRSSESHASYPSAHTAGAWNFLRLRSRSLVGRRRGSNQAGQSRHLSHHRLINHGFWRVFLARWSVPHSSAARRRFTATSTRHRTSSCGRCLPDACRPSPTRSLFMRFATWA